VVTPEEVKQAYRPRLRPIQWQGDKLVILDQSKLPFEQVWLTLTNYLEVAEAIKTMKVRGAPAIGITAAYGLALAAKDLPNENAETMLKRVEEAAEVLRKTRPTAVNLFWAINRVVTKAREVVHNGYARTGKQLFEALVDEANRIFDEEFDAEIRMGLHALRYLEDGMWVMTQCNAGGLATGTGLGTALAPMKLAKWLGMDIGVYVPETRPWQQGAKLTTYELIAEGIRTKLIADTAVGLVMLRKMVSASIVGADRILMSGHVFNKIGTLNQAIIAHELGIPIYVLAPTSTIDRETKSPDDVEIEVRNPMEVTHVRTREGWVPVTLTDLDVYNPVFDVTPPKYITAIITEVGVATQPLHITLRRLIDEGGNRRETV